MQVPTIYEANFSSLILRDPNKRLPNTWYLFSPPIQFIRNMGSPISQVPSANQKCQWKIPELNGGLIRKIIDFYGPCSSKPYLMKPDGNPLISQYHPLYIHQTSTIYPLLNHYEPLYIHYISTIYPLYGTWNSHWYVNLYVNPLLSFPRPGRSPQICRAAGR